jgi:ethanolamine utilization protein EutP (predicted NTPase)
MARFASRDSAVLLAAMFIVGSLASHAEAAPIERERYAGTETGTEFTCGVTYEFEVTFSGLFMLKDGRAGDPTPYLFDNYQYRDVHHDADGRGWILEGRGLYKDLQITHVEGTVYQFVAIEPGQPFSIRTLDGRAVLRDRGVLKTTFMVDTKGDFDLSNDEFIESSFEVLLDAGAHPGFYLAEEEFCAAVEAAVQG